MLSARRAVFARRLRRSDSGEDVRRLQELLRRASYDPGRADGNFGSSTEAAVLALQRAENLGANGVADRPTMAALTRATVQTGKPRGESTTGLSLHIGLNQVNASAYNFHVPDLAGCVNDANDMLSLAHRKGFRPRQLLNSAATSAAVIESIQRAAEQLHSGDIFWISYSGHGSQVPDPLEDDRLSETWVLWDRQLLDNELYALWGRFRAGVRVLIISDSCHSGTVSRELRLLNAAVSHATEQARDISATRPETTRAAVVLPTEAAVRIALTLTDTVTTVLRNVGVTRRGAARALVDDVMGLLLGSTATRDVTTLDTPRLLPPDLAAADISRRADLYRSEVSRSTEWPAPQCTVLLEAACQDNQTASDGRPDPSGHQNGAFTRALRNVWESATDYADLHAQIVRQLPPTQSPNRYWATGPDTAFDAQPPFTI
jgi:hypothetical protein